MVCDSSMDKKLIGVMSTKGRELGDLSCISFLLGKPFSGGLDTSPNFLWESKHLRSSEESCWCRQGQVEPIQSWTASTAATLLGADDARAKMASMLGFLSTRDSVLAFCVGNCYWILKSWIDVGILFCQSKPSRNIIRSLLSQRKTSREFFRFHTASGWTNESHAWRNKSSGWRRCGICSEEMNHLDENI